MKDLVKESDPGRQMDAILKSLHSYASSPADLNEDDLGKIEELADHLEDILGYAEITNRFVGKGGLLVIEAFLHYPSDCAAELEYIGEYILDFVDVKDIPPETLEDIIACLKSRKV
ncbi:hypothetical protein OSTOST_25944, partial [Ostertagia ostertagi]